MNIKSVAAVILISLLILNCNETDQTEFSPEFVTNYKLSLPEPSDLALSIDGKSLWTVSDSISAVYKISFDGHILKQIAVDGYDLEGVTQINDTTLAVILERDRTIVIVDTNGVELNRVKINKSGELNLGFEGITYNSDNKHLYIVNEKEPGELIEIDENYDIVKETILTFAKDYSGINYNKDENGFWIISDESSMLAKCDINGNVINSFSFKLRQIEGVAVDKKNKLIYLVSDPEEEMYIYKY